MPIVPIVDNAKCKGVDECGECIDICPMDVFDKGKDGKCDPVSADACEGCESCVETCEEEAITLEGDED